MPFWCLHWVSEPFIRPLHLKRSDRALTYSSPVWLLEIVQLPTLWSFFAQPSLEFNNRLKEIMCRLLVWFFCVAPSSLLFCTENYNYFSIPLSDICFSARSGAPFTEPWFRKHLQAVIWSNCRVYLVCFSSLKNHSPLLPLSNV